MAKVRAYKLILLIVCCLALGQPGISFAQGPATPSTSTSTTLPPTTNTWEAIATVKLPGDTLERVFDLAFRIMLDKNLYEVLNSTFPSNVTAINTRGNGLSLSQVLYILSVAPSIWTPLEKGLDDSSMTRDEFRRLLAPILAKPELKASIAKHNDPARPLRLDSVRGGSAWESMRMYVNHPRLLEPGNPKSPIVPSEDLRKLVIDFIKGAKHEIMYNVFDFDLEPVADALIASHQRGVKIHGGVDLAVYNTKKEVKTLVDRLKLYEAHGLRTTLVKSVGLNHQKLIVRDAGTPHAAVLLLSGNFTQSCIGPEGDAIHVPKANRPKISIPNANHAVLIKGQLPAAVVKQELRKTLVYGLKGQSGYPVGGAFQLMGPKPKAGVERSWIVLTFSPNGGLGEINRDVLTRVIRDTRGPIQAVHFAFSSEILKNEIAARILKEANARREKGQPATELFSSVGDTPFAMQFWSAFLALSGMKQDRTTGRYEEIANDPIQLALRPNEYKDLRERIRIAPRLYGEKYFVFAGQSVKVTSKIHHKVFIFPESNVSVVGTSFNPSSAAESNQEQVLVVRDPVITKIARGMFEYLYLASASSVYQEAMRRTQAPYVALHDGEDGVADRNREAAQ